MQHNLFSSLPLAVSFILFLGSISSTAYFHGSKFGLPLVLLSIVALIFLLLLWLKDLMRDMLKVSNTQSLLMGMTIFICTEIVLFGCIFIVFFKYRIFETKTTTEVWPSIQIVNWPGNIILPYRWNLPLLNTLILLLSSCTLSFSEHFLNLQNKKIGARFLICTIILGSIFLFFQCLEYYCLDFKLSKNIYASTFYFINGFHTLHLIIGILMLVLSYLRCRINLFATAISDINYSQDPFFIFTKWYWHFIDLLWLIIFFFVYS